MTRKTAQKYDFRAKTRAKTCETVQKSTGGGNHANTPPSPVRVRAASYSKYLATPTGMH